MLMSLKDRAKLISNREMIEFMEGREKGKINELTSRITHIIDYGFINSENGPFVVFIVREEPNRFYFGGQVLTDMLRELDDYRDDIRKEGLPMLLECRVSKKGRPYYAPIFYPEDE